MKNKYIVFEGIVGCGKTTQSKLLAEKLSATWTREPGGTEIAEAIRKLFQGTKFDEEMDPICEQYLVAAARAQSLRKLVKPKLEKGETIVCDYSVFTSVAYQGFGRGLGHDLVMKINDAAVNGLLPDRVFVLDVPIEKAIGRTFDTNGDKFETLGPDFFQKVKQGYDFLTQKYPDIFVVIDGSGSIDEVSKMIYDRLDH